MRTRPLLLAAWIIATLGVAAPAHGGVEPPEGPPWLRTWPEARKQAKQSGKPVFIYFTKTYCPHCVPLEENVFPAAELEPAHEEAVWLFVSRTRTGDEHDLEAERVHDRFSVSSWPHMVVIDPIGGALVRVQKRSVAGLREAIEAVRAGMDAAKEEGAGPPDDTQAAQADAAIRELEAWIRRHPEGAEVKEITRLAGILEDADADIVLRIRALRWLAAHAPHAVVDRSEGLLAIPHDGVRFAVLDLLAGWSDAPAGAGRAATALLVDPAGSQNPNVLRSRAAAALGWIGDARAAEPLAGIVREANPLNSLTGIAVEALARLAPRLEGEARRTAEDALTDAWPAAPGEGDHPRMGQYALALVRRIHAALQNLDPERPLPAVPSSWDEDARQEFITAVRAARADD